MDYNTAGCTETLSEHPVDALGIGVGLVYNAMHWSTISRCVPSVSRWYRELYLAKSVLKMSGGVSDAATHF